ncbi:hypothetical protein C2845_PM15G13970 [Panicum miliaceum]|uniref:Dicer-like protein 4 n=1 Tax=Panicum miliaceum TaxID=4540 RepID=A0A3L6QE44_PANMI|nr:hypothetical protein C2845_PM15G13970 [Panicum miliaceum]
MGEGEDEASSSGAAASAAAVAGAPKDPRTIARNFEGSSRAAGLGTSKGELEWFLFDQFLVRLRFLAGFALDLCKRAVEENIIVYLGTGCGKTHIAMLLMYELGHLIRKPSREQAIVIADSTNFKVQRYYGSGKNLRDHKAWENEMAEYEVLVMTPQIFLHNLRHCFIKMDSVALLVFDECHHAQAPTRHPYAQIMKEFYNNVDKPPRVFGMTASPIIGKGGSNKLIYTKCINSLEELLNAKVCSVDNVELESVVASPEIEVYFYCPVGQSNLTATYSKGLDGYKLQSECMLRESLCNFKESQKKLKSLWRLHENLIFCLQEVGLFGALQVSWHSADADSVDLETLEEPFFSKKFAVLIDVLSRYRLEENMKCIVFVKRIIVARVVAHILQNLKCLDFWKCEFLVGCHSGLKNMSRNKMGSIIEKFSSGEVNLLVATSEVSISTCTRGNQSHEKLVGDYIIGESIMDKEINSRTSNDMFDCLEENIYRVNDNGASISSACSVSLLHRYCDNLPRDMFSIPSPAFFYVDDVEGIVCRLILPPNAAFRQVNSQPCPSKDEAKRDACLKACKRLHELRALTDFLLPGQDSRKTKVSTIDISEINKAEDESFREELHEMLIPAILTPSRYKLDCLLNLHFYYIEFIPKPADRRYQMFGLFVIDALPKEAEKLDMMLARNFQEMCLKVLLDRSEFTESYVMLGNDAALQMDSTFYLLLPIKEKFYGDKFMIDWPAVKRCLSSPVLQDPRGLSLHDSYLPNESLKLLDGTYSKVDVIGSLVFTPHNNLFFFVDVILDEVNAKSEFNSATYEEYFEKLHIVLSHPEQPLLKAKQLFNLCNLLHNRQLESTESEGREMMEHFVELPPELCSLKIIGFSKDMGSSLSLLPSLMCRLENLLVAIELKDLMLSYFPEASQISASGILEALTTERCLERMSLERFEVLGDAFLKYVVGRHSFISYEGLDEGQLTKRRSDIVKNSNLKTSADVVESLLGAFIVESGFKAAFAFLHWIGIKVNFKDSALYRVLDASSANLSLMNYINISELEELIGYKFKHKGLLIQAFVHPSFNKHSGGCYQRMEFLGDAVLEYLMTSYLYSAYPDLKPGQITDLKSLAVKNTSFAHVAIKKSIHKYLIKDSKYLMAAVNKFENYVNLSNSEKDLSEEPACPKVLGDIVESCVGAVLLDSGFNLNHVWKLMLMLLKPILSFCDMHINPMRELRELFQCNGFELGLPKPTKADGEFHVKNYGYKHKSKSLEEILRVATKKESELIGYDEEPIKVEDDISLETKNLQENGEMEGNIFFKIMKHLPLGAPWHWQVIWYTKQQGHSFMNYVLQTIGNLLEFELCKDEGPSHLRKFTCKVLVQIMGPSATLLECFSDPKLRKKAAQEHAAQGALWCLKQLGYLPKDE